MTNKGQIRLTPVLLLALVCCFILAERGAANFRAYHPPFFLRLGNRARGPKETTTVGRLLKADARPRLRRAQHSPEGPTSTLRDVENFSVQQSADLPDKRIERVKEGKL